MRIKLCKTDWDYDPDWLRVEAFGDADEHLGSVWFEPNEKRPSETIAGCNRSSSRRTLSLMSATTVLLMGSLCAGAWDSVLLRVGTFLQRALHGRG
jgi:hypothetical protein